MHRKENAKGYEEFCKKVQSLEQECCNAKIYVYFVGAMNNEGKSWCPDCNEAEPIVVKAQETFMGKEDIFLTVDVGDKEAWKDITNSFRKGNNTKLTEIPTILLWKTAVRLQGDQCKNIDLLEMFFKETNY